MSAIILAIDLGKFNIIIYAFDHDTRVASFHTFKTTPAISFGRLRQCPVRLDRQGMSPR